MPALARFEAAEEFEFLDKFLIECIGAVFALYRMQPALQDSLFQDCNFIVSAGLHPCAPSSCSGSMNRLPGN